MNNATSVPPGRLSQLREVLVFQFKLALDALRDVLISPLSIAAALLDLLLPAADGSRWFHRVLALGRRSERLIALWRHPGEPADGADVDAGLRRLEEWLRQGELPQAGREQLRGLSERLQRALQGDAGTDSRQQSGTSDQST